MTRFSLCRTYIPVCEGRIAVLAPCETGRAYTEQCHFSTSNPGGFRPQGRCIIIDADGEGWNEFGGSTSNIQSGFSIILMASCVRMMDLEDGFGGVTGMKRG